MSPALQAWGEFLSALPAAWLAITVLVYLAAWRLYQRSGNSPFVLPVLTGSALVVGILLAMGVPYADYYAGARPIHFLAGPAIVLLAVPLYRQWHHLRRLWLPILVALAAGSVAAVVSAMAIAWWLGASMPTIWSLAPKSATMPIGMAMAEQTGGVASLTAVATALTGIFGAIAAPFVMRGMRGATPEVEGFALGLSAHAIGTARALQISETAGAFAALAMILNGIATALLIWLASAYAGGLVP